MPVASILSEITHELTAFIGDHGLYAVFALMLIDAVFPAASELVMVYGGALAAGAVAGHVSLFGERIETPFWGYVAISLAGTIGYTIGSLLGWWVGARGGRPFLERYGRRLHLSHEKLDRAERWFERWDRWAVFIGRITPVVRSFISIPAGVFRSPLGPYTALTLIGSALWAFAFAGIGWGVGASYERFNHAFHYAEYAILALIAAAVAYWLFRRRSTRLRNATEDPAH